jgi:hypothetical protein
MPSLYALIVGIDSYDPASTISIPQLFGCVNDAAAFTAFVQQSCAHLTPNILSLNNAQATRANVLSGFRDHLGRAVSDDSALFFFAGHGSQQPALPADADRKPDGQDQTRVLYDSRTAGGQDLVDTELAQLLAAVTAQGVHMTVVLDCCHSGSSTRGLAPGQPLATRQMPARPDTPASTLLAPSGTASTPAPANGIHIALEACDASELANEYPGPGGLPRGAFTLFLLQELQATPDLPSYADVMQRVGPRLQTVGQTPQLELVNTTNDLLQNVFLGSAPAPPAQGIYLRYTILQTWQLDAGSLLGFSVGDTFAIYPSGDAAQRNASQILTTATIASLTPSNSVLTPADPTKLDTATVYTAVVVSRAARINVSFEGDPAGQQLLRTAASNSAYIKEAPAPRLTITSSAEPNGQFSFAAPLLHGRLPAPLLCTPDNAAGCIAALEHMAQWLMRLELQASQSVIPGDQVQLSITQCDLPGVARLHIPMQQPRGMHRRQRIAERRAQRRHSLRFQTAFRLDQALQRAAANVIAPEADAPVPPLHPVH